MQDSFEEPPDKKIHLGGNPTLEATLIPVIILSIWFAISIVLNPLLPPIIDFYVVSLLRFGLLVLFMRQVHGKDLKWAWRNLGFIRPVIKPVLFGLLISLPMVLIYIGIPLITGRSLSLLAGWPYLLPVILVGPGLFEEGLFRGYVFNHYVTFSKMNWMKAAFFSGILFSLSHLINLLAGVALFSIFISITFAFPISFLFGYMFIKMSKNIWGCVSAHVAIDMVAGTVILSDNTIGLQMLLLFLSIIVIMPIGFILVNRFYPSEQVVESL